MLQEDVVLPRATEPPFLLALHAKNETNAEQTFLAINLANQQKTKKGPLFLWGKETIQTFNSSIKAFTLLFAKWYTCELPSFKIVQRLYLNFRVIWSVNQIVLKMVSSLILLRSLRVYILKQSFFSISVSSGFRNIYLAANDQPLFTSISKNNC